MAKYLDLESQVTVDFIGTIGKHNKDNKKNKETEKYKDAEKTEES